MLTGFTGSSDFPTTPWAYDRPHNGDLDVLVAKLCISGSCLSWSTFLGGSGGEQGLGASLDVSGNVVVTGLTISPNFPTTPGAYDESYNGGSDVFTTRLSESGSCLLWGTYVGGTGDEQGWDLSLDSSGNAVVTGVTWFSDLPATQGAYDTSFNGGSEAFVSKFELCPASDVREGEYKENDLYLEIVPNPVSGPATLSYRLDQGGPVSLLILDVSGRLVRNLFRGTYPYVHAGEFSLTWDELDDEGRRVPSGVYIARVDAPGRVTTGRVIVTR